MVLILAYGNSLRRDDGAGFVLADKVQRLLTNAGALVKRIDSHQLMPELSLDIAEDNISSVIFIDTRAVKDPSDNLRIGSHRIKSADGDRPGMGHHLNASALLTYTRYLFKKEPPAWLLTAPGVDFDHGEEFSEVTKKALEGTRNDVRDVLIEVLKIEE